jgi:hypothetical protein
MTDQQIVAWVAYIRSQNRKGALHPWKLSMVNRISGWDWDSPFNTRDCWVSYAEELMQAQGGILPNVKWLRTNGHGGLNSAMRSYPERFEHLKQKQLVSKIPDLVKQGEDLAVEHGGILPNIRWLRDNGYAPLARAIYKHPSLFAHIKLTKKLHSVEESVKEAYAVAKKHGGILPSVKWLRTNGHGNIARALRTHADMFSHIPQVRLVKTIDERVIEAEELARANGGILRGLVG